MTIQKRDCGIKIKFCELKVGWLYMNFDIEDKHFYFKSSYCLGDGIEDLISIIYNLNPNRKSFEYDDRIKSSDYDIPISAQVSLCEEGSWINWKFEREDTKEIDCNLKIYLTVDREAYEEDDEEVEKYEFTVRYIDFCYALAKACTEMLKEYGIVGYWQSYWRQGFPLREFLEIKAVALNNYDYVKTTFDDDAEKSNINKEIEFLLLDM